ncbi:MAG TPA: lipocalin family protein [Rhizomicrobium sp.]|jgi:hypothetical protein|nr:lipocalin family protein [Rhizomicrobium sp.]
MRKTGLLILCLVAALGASRAVAGGLPPDADIARKLLGSWTVPPQSSDYVAGVGYPDETFDSAGTYSFRVYQDQSCRVQVSEAHARWTIEHGVLNSVYEDGSADQDEIVSIIGDTLTLHSKSDGITYTRVRIAACGHAAN